MKEEAEIRRCQGRGGREGGEAGVGRGRMDYRWMQSASWVPSTQTSVKKSRSL